MEIALKIKKLLRLAGSENTAEAALAMARAQELLAKYNLDYTVVQDTEEIKPEKREKVRIDRSAKYKWQVDLWTALAETNYCWYWTTRVWLEGKKTRVGRHVLLGKESNVAAVCAMGEYLEDVMARLCPYNNGAFGPAKALMHSWRVGCVEELVQRIRAKAEDMNSAPSESKALALRDVVQMEYEANYDACHGPGAYKRKLIADEEWEQRQKQLREERRIAREKAEQDWLVYLQNESMDQKQAREKKEARAARAEERRWARRRYSYSYYRPSRKKESNEVHLEARNAGAASGKEISLRTQLSTGDKRRAALIE